MRCPECRTENLPDSSFCEECSAPLEATCPSCGTTNRPTAKFCRKYRTSLAMACAACGTANEPGEKFCAECGAPLQGVQGLRDSGGLPRGRTSARTRNHSIRIRLRTHFQAYALDLGRRNGALRRSVSDWSHKRPRGCTGVQAQAISLRHFAAQNDLPKNEKRLPMSAERERFQPVALVRPGARTP